MFFSDAVVFVEGISDRLVFQKLVEEELLARKSLSVIEIVEVHGKNNFSTYQKLADSLRVPNFLIADFDYLKEVGGEEVSDLFKFGDKKLKQTMKKKKSEDRKSLSSAIEEAISGQPEKLRELWPYLKTRNTLGKPDLSVEEQTLVATKIEALGRNRLHILSFGEIEDYFSMGADFLGTLVSLTDSKSLSEKARSQQHWDELRQLRER
jgi:predicted ATP-dependent endonuclease of OLD family